uniref:Vitellogenin domain-containing protein n=1 Tax=Ascaris lumbricoides TaxID=6252 RepID=A0A0M3ICY5_ASCLU
MGVGGEHERWLSDALSWRRTNQRDSESSGTRSTVEPLLGDYDERSWFGESGVPDPARDPIAQAINLLAKPDTMGNLEALIRDSESSGTRSTVEPLLGDYDERSWFGESGVPDPARDPIAQAINLLAKPDTMGNLEALISWFGESGVPDPARDPIAQAINLLAKPDTMGNLEALIRLVACFSFISAPIT